MILESICLIHFIAAVVLVGLFFLVGHIIKPASIIHSMSSVEESRYDLMHQNKDGRVIIVQLKENVPHGKCNEQETIACH